MCEMRDINTTLCASIFTDIYPTGCWFVWDTERRVERVVTVFVLNPTASKLIVLTQLIVIMAESLTMSLATINEVRTTCRTIDGDTYHLNRRCSGQRSITMHRYPVVMSCVAIWRLPSPICEQRVQSSKPCASSTAT